MSQSVWQPALLVFLAATVIACGDDNGPEGDAGQDPDAATLSGDGGPSGDVPDAGSPDAGDPDGGEPDAGDVDAGDPDAGDADAGDPDAGDADGGGPDAGDVDAGDPDAGDGNDDRDGDGVPNDDDPAPDDPKACGDRDGDTCDDCVSGSRDPSDDGTDADNSGACDACDAALCSGQGVCVPDGNTTACQCDSGWTGDDCATDVDECATGDNPCDEAGDSSASCNNVDGGYTCTCSSGFDDVAGVCQDVDECVTDDNPCNDDGDTAATCTNTDGDYTCTCNSGFTAEAGGCQDVDECVTDDNPCDEAGDPAATCMNVAGGYTCHCTPGVGGDDCDTDYPSCQGILNAGIAQGDGTYVINPSGGARIQVECDMTTDGGGWTGITMALAQSAFGGITVTSQAGGTCDLNGDNPRSVDTVDDSICYYDIDLGFQFNHLRLANGEITSTAAAGATSDVTLGTGPWGMLSCIDVDPYKVGDVRLGVATSSDGALSLGAELGLAYCAEYYLLDAGNSLAWSGETYTREDTVLRLELAEYGTQAEGWEWTAGTIFVRLDPGAIVTGAGTPANPKRWQDGEVATSCEAYRRPPAGYLYGGNTGSAVYSIDPDGSGAGMPFNAYCDMETDGGGWTLLGIISGADGDNWADQYGYWSDTQTLGGLNFLDADYKGKAWNELDLTGAEVLIERQHDGVIQGQSVLATACLQGQTSFADLFTTPTDTSLACTPGDIRTLLGEATGVAAGYEEGAAQGLGGSSTNGFCWSGGDNQPDTFDGHLLWSDQSHTNDCLNADAHGGVGVYAASGASYATGDIAQTPWLSGQTTSSVVVRLYAR